MRPETVLHGAVELVCDQNPRLVLTSHYEQMKAAALELARQIVMPTRESSIKRNEQALLPAKGRL